MTNSRLTDAHSGFAAPHSPHTLLSGFSQRRDATWLQDRALEMVEDSLPNQLARSLEESKDRLQKVRMAKDRTELKWEDNKTTEEDRHAGKQTANRRLETDKCPIKHLKVLYGVMRVNECFPDDLIEATFRGMEKEAMPSWKPSLLG